MLVPSLRTQMHLSNRPLSRYLHNQTVDIKHCGVGQERMTLLPESLGVRFGVPMLA
jgi:hypothetical protein